MYPLNKGHRFEIAHRKGRQRAKLFIEKMTGSSYSNGYTEEERLAIERSRRNGYTTCSCSMCCNKRRHGFKTLQEIKAGLSSRIRK